MKPSRDDENYTEPMEARFRRILVAADIRTGTGGAV